MGFAGRGRRAGPRSCHCQHALYSQSELEFPISNLGQLLHVEVTNLDHSRQHCRRQRTGTSFVAGSGSGDIDFDFGSLNTAVEAGSPLDRAQPRLQAMPNGNH